MVELTMTQEQIKEMLDLNKRLTELVQQKTDLSGVQKEVQEKVITDLTAVIEKKFDELKPKSKMVYDSKVGTLLINGEKIGIQKFLNMIKNNDVDSMVMKTTIMSESSNAQGGYAVPVEYLTQILGALNNAATLPSKVTTLTQGSNVAKIPGWLTDLTIYWVDEDATKTLTKPTLTQKTLTLKKMAAVIPFTDELLDDNNVDLSGQIPVLIGENIGLEIERVALVGDVTGAGDPFNGVTKSTGVLNAQQAGTNFKYDDLVNLMYHSSMLKQYRATGEWWMNTSALKLIMKLKDANQNPVWALNLVANGIEPKILGRVFNETDQISDTAAGTTIIFGDVKYIIVGNPKKNAGINVLMSQHAVAPATGSLTQNAYLQDETWFRFVKRCSILIGTPAAFCYADNIK